MNTYKNRFFIVTLLALIVVALSAFTLIETPEETINTPDSPAVELATDYIQNQDMALLSPDAKVYLAGSDFVLSHPDAIAYFHDRLYQSRGTVSGVETTIHDVTVVSDNLVMVEYSYSGTAFYGDVYPLDSMIDYEKVNIAMVSLLEIENGRITGEIIFDASLPDAMQLNYPVQ